MIVEGPDGAGKTTLLQRLSRDLGVQVQVWPEARSEMASTGLFRRVFGSLGYEVSASTGQPARLHDRLYFSELVYGQILRGKHAFMPNQVRIIENVLWGLSIPIIFCRPPLEVVKQNIAQSQGTQLDGVPEHIERIWNQYCVYPSEWRPQSLVYDYTGMTQPTSSYELIVERCEKYLQRRERRTWQS